MNIIITGECGLMVSHLNIYLLKNKKNKILNLDKINCVRNTILNKEFLKKKDLIKHPQCLANIKYSKNLLRLIK
jgi:dTDP-D-glucose 4,6-dehydratase